MPEAICNTSPIQYLYQLGLLNVLQSMTGQVAIPPAVVRELEEGRRRGIVLPDVSALSWLRVKRPTTEAVLPLVVDLGPGETEVLALALEARDAVVILDDAFARRVATKLEVPLIGTLGVLLEAKRYGLVPAIAPLLDQLMDLSFRLAPHTREAVIKLAGES